MTTITDFEAKYQRYMDNMKRANKRYFNANKETINAKCRMYYTEKLASNLEYKTKKQEYNKARYLKKKQEKQELEKLKAI